MVRMDARDGDDDGLSFEGKRHFAMFIVFFNQLDLKEKFFGTFLDTCVWYEGFICQLSWGTNLETPDG